MQAHPPSQFDPDKEFPPLKWLVEHLWLGGGKINGVFGTPKSGKSRFVGWLLASLLARKPPLDGLNLGNVRPERVLYLLGEEDEESVTRRLQMYGAIFGADVSGWRDVLTFMPAMNMMLEKPSRREFLRTFIAGEGIDLMIADPYVRLHGADENDASAMAPIHNELRKWTHDMQMDLILVHHTGKLDETLALDHDMNRWGRGTSDIAAILDTGILLQRTSNGVRLFRGGRYTPQPRLFLFDRGDQKGWLLKPNRESESSVA